MGTERSESERRASPRFVVFLVVAALLTPCLTYGGGYSWARLTHRLVRYQAGDIGSPFYGGTTVWQLVFIPAIAVELWSRQALRRIAGAPPAPVSYVDGS